MAAAGILTRDLDPGLRSVKVMLNRGSSCSPILTPTLFLPSLHRWKFNCGKAELRSCFVLHPQGLDDFYLSQRRAPSLWPFAEKAFPSASQGFFWNMSDPTVPREHPWFKEALAGQAGNSSWSQIEHQTHPHPPSSVGSAGIEQLLPSSERFLLSVLSQVFAPEIDQCVCNQHFFSPGLVFLILGAQSSSPRTGGHRSRSEVTTPTVGCAQCPQPDRD